MFKTLLFICAFFLIAGEVSEAQRRVQRHTTQHKHGGTDEVATATPAANALVKAEAGGDIAEGWIPTTLGQGYTFSLILDNTAGYRTPATVDNFFGFVNNQNGLRWRAGGPVLNSSGNLYFNIDSNNNGSGNFIRIAHNTETDTGGTQIAQLEEDRMDFSVAVAPIRSATEPFNCDSTRYGFQYYNTGDTRLCICIADGTDDEWVKSDDYTHATGHCS